MDNKAYLQSIATPPKPQKNLPFSNLSPNKAKIIFIIAGIIFFAISFNIFNSLAKNIKNKPYENTFDVYQSATIINRLILDYNHKLTSPVLRRQNSILKNNIVTIQSICQKHLNTADKSYQPSKKLKSLNKNAQINLNKSLEDAILNAQLDRAFISSILYQISLLEAKSLKIASESTIPAQIKQDIQQNLDSIKTLKTDYENFKDSAIKQ